MPKTDKSIKKTSSALGITKSSKFKKKGATGNTYLHMLLKSGAKTSPELAEIAQLIKESHRITPVATKKAASGKTVFTDVTGYHEWIPTDQAATVALAGNVVWSGLYTALRSPTWLLILNPDKFNTNAQWRKVLQTAASHAKSGSTSTVNASELGLVGHSGGLNLAGTDQTTWQSTWHDLTRDIFTAHLSTNAYDAYFGELTKFITDNFLFVADESFPGTEGLGVPATDVMKKIKWDLQISGRGNPTTVAIDTLYDAATFLRAEWATSSTTLLNGFKAYRSMAV